jgi:translation initiation factor IF-3
LGIVSLAEALRMAGELDVDLVEIAATANPPVCRLMDYGKFKYQEQKKAAEAKAKQTVIEIKEVKFRPGTDDGDYNIKMRNIRRFLAEGDKCKITLRFRGREITHQEIGMALLNRIRDELADQIVVEQFPKLEGRQMIMMIAPGQARRLGLSSLLLRRRRLVEKNGLPAALAVRQLVRASSPSTGRAEKPSLPRRPRAPMGVVASDGATQVARGQQVCGIDPQRLTSTT